MKKEKIQIIEFSDGERTLKCDKRGCILVTPCFEMKMDKLKEGYFFQTKIKKYAE